MSYAAMKARPRTRPATQAARVLNDLKIPWVYGPEPGRRPDFRLWPDVKHPWYLETQPPSDDPVADANLPVVLTKLSHIRTEHPDAVLLLWHVQPAHPDKGHLLVNVPGGEWIHRLAADFFGTAAPVLNPPHPVPIRQRRWWHRFFGR